MNIIVLLISYIRAKYFGRFKNRTALERHQQKKWRKLRKFVIRKSPFYRKMLAQESADMPSFVINKKIMMDNFDQLNTRGVNKQDAFEIALKAETDRKFDTTLEGCTIGLSSGTSGHRGLFLVSPHEQSTWAGNILAKVLPGSILERHSVALFLRANSNLYEETNKGKISFHYFDLINSLETHVERLNAIQPDVVLAPPSILRRLAASKKQGTLTIEPTKIISVAEVLDPIDKAYIENIFKQTLHQVYQATEGFLGYSCEYGTLHLNEDNMIIEKEYIDKAQGKFVPIITDLYRYAQPFIRYRLNDILTERQSPCPCGSTLIAINQIEGRCDDVFYFRSKDNSRWIPILPDFIRRTVLAASELIDEYQVIQNTADTITVAIKTSGKAHEIERVQAELNDKFNQLWLRFNIQAPTLQFGPYQVEGGLNKLRRIERQFMLDDERCL